MGFIPKQKRRPMLVAAVIILLLSAGVSMYFRLLGVGFLALFSAVLILGRYLLQEMCYIMSPRGSEEISELAASYSGVGNMPYSMLDLTVTRRFLRGEPVVQSVLSLECLCETVAVDGGLIRELKRKYKAENGGRFVVYDYTVTPASRDRLMLIFEDGEEYIGVLLEAEGPMRQLLETVG